LQQQSKHDWHNERKASMTTAHHTTTGTTRPKRRGALRLGLAVAGSGALVGALALAAVPAAQASQAGAASPASTHYLFRTINNHRDVTFNQLLGINNKGRIAGYFGSGMAGHPNKGYLIKSPYHQGNFVNENFPHSVQTQVTGLNDHNVQVGFYSTQNNANLSNNNFGFYVRSGHFHVADFPTHNVSSPPVDQLLGVNNHDIAVGFFTKSNGDTQGYLADLNNHKYFSLHVAGATSTAATGINDSGSIAGFFVNSKGVTKGFYLRHTGQIFVLRFPGASTTEALGANNNGEVVGFYQLSSTVMHGFTWTRQHGFRTVNDPKGVNTTTINGVNNHGDLVGFYVDAAGNTDGFLGVPLP
jgi:hypothetical protein